MQAWIHSVLYVVHSLSETIRIRLKFFWGASIFGGLVAGIIWKRISAITIAADSGDGVAMFDQHTINFATFEFFSSALGNWVLAVVVLLMGHYGIEGDDFVLINLAVIFLLFALFYFPTGGHMNPSLSVGCYTAGVITLPQTLLYITAQVGGSLLAMEFVRYVAPNSLHGYFRAPVPPYLKSVAGLEEEDNIVGFGGLIYAAGYECICTVLMVLVSFAGDSFDRHYIFASLLVVLLVMYTGAGMDPLSWLCGSWFAWDEEYGEFEKKVEVYWGAGLSGGAIAGWFWRMYKSRGSIGSVGGDVKEKLE